MKEGKYEELVSFLESEIVHDISRNKIWMYRSILRSLPKEVYEKSAIICSACAIIAELADNFALADYYISVLQKMQLNFRVNSLEYKEIESYLRCLDIECSHRSTKEIFYKFKLFLEILDGNTDAKIKPTITLNRPSLLNGARDNYRYVRYLVTARKPLDEIAEKLYHENGLIILNIACAEALYQENRISESLLILANNIPALERLKDANILFVALYLRYSILIMTGQLDSVYCMLDSIKQKMMTMNADYLLPNLAAIRVWAALLECNYLIIDDWMKNEAPNENDEFCNLDRFQYFIKLRVYLLYGKHLLLVTLAERLFLILNSLNRNAELCELYTILAMSYYDQKEIDKAYAYLKEALDLCEKFGLYRIIANEGSKIYMLLRDYACEYTENEVLVQLIQMSRNVGLFYPDYLKSKINKIASLTSSEMDVLRLVCAERTNAEIADFLNISLRTVKFHTSNIFEKMSVKNRQQASKMARKYNLV